VSSSGLIASMEMSVLLVSCIVNDALLNSGPDINKTLTQIVSVQCSVFIDMPRAVALCSNFIVNWI